MRPAVARPLFSFKRKKAPGFKKEIFCSRCIKAYDLQCGDGNNRSGLLCGYRKIPGANPGGGILFFANAARFNNLLHLLKKRAGKHNQLRNLPQKSLRWRNGYIIACSDNISGPLGARVDRLDRREPHIYTPCRCTDNTRVPACKGNALKYFGLKIRSCPALSIWQSALMAHITAGSQKM